MQMPVCVLPCLGSENKNKTEEKIQRLSNIPAKEKQEAPRKNMFVLVMLLLFCVKSQQVLCDPWKWNQINISVCELLTRQLSWHVQWNWVAKMFNRDTIILYRVIKCYANIFIMKFEIFFREIFYHHTTCMRKYSSCLINFLHYHNDGCECTSWKGRGAKRR